MALAPKNYQLKLPPREVQLVQSDGTMDYVWYQYFRGLEKALIRAGIVTIADYDPSALTTGQTLRWNATAVDTLGRPSPRFIPGA